MQAKKKRKMESKVITTEDAVHIKWMKKAINISWLSNPVESAYCVGCVIINNSNSEARCLSTGYSRELPGNTHAEECALKKLANISHKGTKLDMYTTMEPCSKRLSGNTPCCNNIISANVIKNVYVGATEPENLVQCNGVKLLQQAGIHVISVRDPKNTIKSACLAPNIHILDQNGTSRFRIRLYRHSDLKYIQELLKISSQNIFTNNSNIPSNSSELSQYIEEKFTSEKCKKNGCGFFCAEQVLPSEKKVLAASDSNLIVGIAAVAKNDDFCVAQLFHLLIKPLFHDKGLAEKLINYVEKHSKMNAFKKLIIVTPTISTNVTSVYQH